MKFEWPHILVWTLNAVLIYWVLHLWLGKTEGPDTGMAQGIATFIIFLPLSLITILLSVFLVKHRLHIIMSSVVLLGVLSPIIVEFVASGISSGTKDPAAYQHLVGKPFEEARDELPADLGFAGGARLYNGMKVFVDEKGIITKIVAD